MREDNTALYLLLTSVKHLVYTESYLLFYCFVTVSLKNYHSVYQLVSTALNIFVLWSKLCHLTACPWLQITSDYAEHHRTVVLHWYHPIWQGLATYSTSFCFLTDSPLCYSYMDSFKTSGERSCQKHFRIETFYIIQWAVSMGADKKLIHFQFQTK